MAITFGKAGDRWGPNASSVVPKSYVAASYVAAWAAGALPTGKLQTVPQVGDLVIQDASIDNGVKQCVASDVPYGEVLSVNSSNSTLSVLKFIKTFSVVMETANGVTVTRGHQIQANGSPGTIPVDGVLRDQVKDVASSGAGLIATANAGTTPGLITVEFGS